MSAIEYSKERSVLQCAEALAIELYGADFRKRDSDGNFGEISRGIGFAKGLRKNLIGLIPNSENITQRQAAFISVMVVNNEFSSDIQFSKMMKCSYLGKFLISICNGVAHG